MIRPGHFTTSFLIFVGALSHLTPTYPQPVDLTSNDSLVAQGWKDLSLTIDESLNKSEEAAETPLAAAKNVTFSLGMFSLHDPAATNMQYHYAGPETRNSKIGTTTPDGNSIYMLASISKLITAYTGMVLLSEEDWNRPLPDIIPALRTYAHRAVLGPGSAYTTPWDHITLAALASHQSGMATKAWVGADQAVYFTSEGQEGLSAMLELGLPPLDSDISKLGPCATRAATNASDLYCSGPDAIQALAGIPPNFLPWTTPAYSDGAYMLIGMALSNITNKPLTDVYAETMFLPLGMSSTYTLGPTDNETLSHSIVSEETLAQWTLNTGFTTPTGGILSTTNDLARFGIAILNNTLLSAETTRKWMKPQTHTGSLSYSVGRGWEIHRFLHPTTSKVIDLYTKLGDGGAYGSAMVLIPQFDAGFTILSASSDAGTRGEAMLVILDYVTNSIVPALEAQAQAEAIANYVGTYTSTGDQVNASVTIAFNQSDFPGVASGLTLTEWSFNGTDALASLIQGRPRLEPSISKQTPDGSPGQVAFQLSPWAQPPTYMNAMQEPNSSVLGTWTGFYSANRDFGFTDLTRYAGIGVNLFVFDVDGEGRAMAVSPALQRVTLRRKTDD